MRRSEAIVVHDVSAMVPEAEVKTLLGQDVRSGTAVPLSLGGQLVGFMAFCAKQSGLR